MERKKKGKRRKKKLTRKDLSKIDPSRERKKSMLKLGLLSAACGLGFGAYYKEE